MRKKLYTTDVMQQSGNPGENIQLLDALRQQYGEPERDGDGRSFWWIAEDVHDLRPTTADSPVPSEPEES